MDARPSRPILVDTLYGPGTFSCWLLTLASVFTTWLFNRHLAPTDTLSVDFLMAVSLPCIACGHLIFLLTRLPASVRQVLFDPDLAPHAAAMEAPLIICTVYGTLVPLLMALPLWWAGFDPRVQRKRAVVAFVVWVACESVHWSVLVMFGDIPFSIVKLIVVGFSTHVMVPPLYSRRVLSPTLRPGRGMSAVIPSLPSAVWYFLMSGTLQLPAFVFHLYANGYTPDPTKGHLVPRAGASLGDLDQATAFLGGMVAFLYSAVMAVKSRRGGGSSNVAVELGSVQANVEGQVARRVIAVTGRRNSM